MGYVITIYLARFSFAGYKSLRKLRNLEVLDFSLDAFDNSIFPFPKAATSLTTLLFRRNSMDGPFPVKRYVFPFCKHDQFFDDVCFVWSIQFITAVIMLY